MDLIDIQKKLVPELTKVMERRYEILRHIYFNQPIGRRTLANKLGLGERTVRTEVDVLKDQGLLSVESVGMYVTEEGKQIVLELKPLISDIKGISKLESKIESILDVNNVIVVPGHSEDRDITLSTLGRTVADYLKSIVKDNNIIGVTGGTTMSYVAEEMPYKKIAKNLLITPARGGLGENLSTQANNVAAKLAEKLSADYKLLHIQDDLDRDTLDTVLKIPEIKNVVDIINNMDILVFGLGRADEMARRRHLGHKVTDVLRDSNAVAEAFGYFFDVGGKKVLESSTIGISLDKFQSIPEVIAVAAGQEKAEAILSVASLRKNMTIIMDENAALKILDIVK